MGKGILLELEGRTAVVLTPQGEFRRVRVPEGAWEVGDEIEFAEPKPAAAWVRWGLAAAAALALVALPVGYQAWALAQPVALVSIDINPSIELLVNRRDQVLDARGLNEEGAQLLQAVTWKRRPVDQVIAEITHQAIATQQLDLADDAGTVVVAVTPAKGKNLPPERVEKILEQARTAVTATVTTEGQERNVVPQVKVPAVQATPEDEEKARELGLSPGQYVILGEIRKAIPGVDVDALREMGPGKLLKSLGVNPGDVFRNAKGFYYGWDDDDDWDDYWDDDGWDDDDRDDSRENGKGRGQGNGQGKGQDAGKGQSSGNGKSQGSGNGKSQGNGNGKGQGGGSGKGEGNGNGKSQGGGNGKGQGNGVGMGDASWNGQGRGSENGEGHGYGKGQGQNWHQDDDHEPGRGKSAGRGQDDDDKRGPGKGNSKDQDDDDGGSRGQGSGKDRNDDDGSSRGQGSGKDRNDDDGGSRDQGSGKDRNDDDGGSRGKGSGKDRNDDAGGSRGHGSGRDRDDDGQCCWGRGSSRSAATSWGSGTTG